MVNDYFDTRMRQCEEAKTIIKLRPYGQDSPKVYYRYYNDHILHKTVIGLPKFASELFDLPFPIKESFRNMYIYNIQNYK